MYDDDVNRAFLYCSQMSVKNEDSVCSDRPNHENFYDRYMYPYLALFSSAQSTNAAYCHSFATKSWWSLIAFKIPNLLVNQLNFAAVKFRMLPPDRYSYNLSVYSMMPVNHKYLMRGLPKGQHKLSLILNQRSEVNDKKACIIFVLFESKFQTMQYSAFQTMQYSSSF